jgi:glycosyltransferase involved in cell wall biosynthesis
MQARVTVSVILPAHNEEPNIRRVVECCREVCRKLFSDHEIIVVDDGSADNTAQAVKDISTSDPKIKLAQHPKNRGYGAALRSGFNASKMDWIFFMDADGQFNPEEMTIMLPYLDDYDMIAGYRIRRSDSAYRRFLGWLFSRSVDLFFGAGLKDVDCAFKFIRGKLLRALTLTTEGALINTEILYQARQKKWRIMEVGVHHYPRMAGEQSGGSSRVITKAIVEYWRLFVRLRSMRSDQGISKT